MTTPVLFMVFNRPELTRQSFAAIRVAKPPRLYVAADGPRSGREQDEELCRETRAIATAVDWPCEVHTLFRKRNRGCKIACSSAITWFFQHEPEGIILEDDCVAHSDFFPYCQELLARYRDDPHIMMLSGSNFEYGKKRGDGSYFFSIFPHIWGWASWASVWEKYDVSMKGAETYIKTKMADKVGHPAAMKVMMQKFMYVMAGIDNTWDYQLVYSIWKDSGLCIIPNTNMIRNIGYVEDSAHPARPDMRMVRPLEGMPNLVHPTAMTPDPAAHLFACETLASDQGGFEQVLIKEGFRRLQEGDTQANHELLRAGKAFYGPLQGLLALEVLNSLAEKNHARAREAHGHMLLLYPNDPLTANLAEKLRTE